MDSSPYELIVENFPDGIVFVVTEDEDGLRYTFVDGEGLADIGLSKETLEGQAVAKGRPTALQRKMRSQYRRALDGERVSFEVEAEGRHFRIRAMPVERNDDAAVGMAQDITEQVLFREELERQNERLERFTDLVFHDIRNPLSVAKGHLEMVREEDDSERLGTVADALDRIEELTSDDTTLVTEARSSLPPVELAQVARMAWRNVVTKEGSLEVSTDLTVSGNEGDLRRMFENLFRNAVEHGGSSVTVTVGEHADGFYVADDGSGIPAAERETVFERGVTTASRGTGFGLFIVANVVDTHGWDIRATAGEDGGARFEITGVEPA